MRLIEIQAGISINPDKIEGIERVDESTCNIYVGSRLYKTFYSYETLISLIRRDEPKPITRKLEAFLDTAGYFAG